MPYETPHYFIVRGVAASENNGYFIHERWFPVNDSSEFDRVYRRSREHAVDIYRTWDDGGYRNAFVRVDEVTLNDDASLCETYENFVVGASYLESHISPPNPAYRA